MKNRNLLENLRSFTETTWFWVILTFLSIISVLFSIQYYPKAFPTIDFPIEMNRTQALNDARQLAASKNWQPKNFQQAASFSLDSSTQTFVELEAGGSQAFADLIRQGLYYPYTWRVRHFAEGQVGETWIQFTPSGDFYGFIESLSENDPGAALSQDQALKIAENSATQVWHVDLSPYNLIEKSQETLPSGRIDHTFTYERKQEKIGEGRFRLHLVVSGDRLTGIRHFIKIPDEFYRRYAEMRSANNTVSEVASIAMGVLYIIGGCGFGIFLLARKKWILWKTPLIVGAIIAFLQVSEGFNQLPIRWMGYNTAISRAQFLLQFISSSLIQFFADFALVAVSLIAAESLTRKAFGHHPQFWKVWSPSFAPSKEILGRTLGGILSVSFFFGYLILVYWAGHHYLGWWSPSDLLFQPDGLASYFPWLTPIALSAHAGVWEEALFRAVPLAGAALLGQRFGRKKLWITAAFVLQALIFAAAHANYPAQPYYARVAELILPSFLFGGLYLIFGLLPGIILHFTFDVVSFAIPLFAAKTPGVWKDQLICVLLTLVPLFVVLIAYLRLGRKRKWNHLPEQSYNLAWKPTLQSQKRREKGDALPYTPPKKSLLISIIIIFGIGFVFWIRSLSDTQNPLYRIDIKRDTAVQLAREGLKSEGILLSPEWTALAMASAPSGDASERFVWKTAGEHRYYSLVSKFLPAPNWTVRFVRFNVDVAQRAEEYIVQLSNTGKLDGIAHIFPEASPGKALDQAQARQVAHVALKKEKFDPQKLVEISSVARQLPNRKDWSFVFRDPSVKLESGEARILVAIAGDQVSAVSTFVFVPEDWTRKEQQVAANLQIIHMISYLFVSLIFVAGFILAANHWIRKEFDHKAFKTSILVLTALNLLSFGNHFPESFYRLSTTDPYWSQIFRTVLQSLFTNAFFALLFGFLFGFLTHDSKKQKHPLSQTDSLLLGYGTGLLGATILMSAQNIIPPMSPSWANVDALNSYIRPLSAYRSFANYLISTLSFSMIFVLMEKTASTRSRKALGMIALLLFSLFFNGMSTGSISQWFASSVAYGFFLIWLYYSLIRNQLSLIPLVCVGPFLLGLVKMAIAQPYRGVTVDIALAMGGFILVSYYWHRYWLKPSR